jgi:hypothetical protein
VKRFLAVLTALVLCSAAADAQTPPAPPTPAASGSGPFTTTYDATLLRDLPTANDLFGTLETLQPTVISDRISGGGLYGGQPSRLGGSVGSWTQTMFRVDGVSITDPTGRGTPLLFPSLALWNRVRVTTGMVSADTNATGLVVDLDPIAPTDHWVRTVDGAVSHLGLTAGNPSGDVPSIAHLDGWDNATVIAS